MISQDAKEASSNPRLATSLRRRRRVFRDRLRDIRRDHRIESAIRAGSERRHHFRLHPEGGEISVRDRPMVISRDGNPETLLRRRYMEGASDSSLRHLQKERGHTNEILKAIDTDRRMEEVAHQPRMKKRPIIEAVLHLFEVDLRLVEAVPRLEEIILRP